MLGLDLELVIWGYLILEYSLSFILFLCKVSIYIKQIQSGEYDLHTTCLVFIGARIYKESLKTEGQMVKVCPLKGHVC